jgi:hypothetical protein
MGAYNYSAGELASQTKKMGKLNLAHLGNSASEQNTYIYYYMTMSMWKYAALNFRKRVSDPLTVASDGYVTFLTGGNAIEDLYEQLRILTPDESGTEVQKRTAFAAPKGWWRESANDPIHMKGAGTYVMQYKAYTDKITADSQIPQWPASCYDLLIYETIGKIKESLNDLEGALAAYAVADKLIPLLVKANTDARGTTGGQPPSYNDIQYYRR